MKKVISIIVPVYNSAGYLSTCLDSLIRQKYPDIEIVLIDNGSTDSSLDICREYQHKDSRIKVYQQIEGHQGAARNLGISRSHGNYLMFVDSDDYVSPDFCNQAIQITDREHADITIFDYVLINQQEQPIVKHIFQTKIRHISKRNAIKSLIHESFLWNKIFKRELFNGVMFPENRTYEDVSTVYKLVSHAHKITYFAKPLYFYVERMGSTVHDCKNMDDMFVGSLGLYSFIKKEYLTVFKSQDVQDALIEIALFYYSKSNRKNIELIKKALNILQQNNIFPRKLGYQSKVLLYIIRQNPKLANFLLNIKNNRGLAKSDV